MQAGADVRNALPEHGGTRAHAPLQTPLKAEENDYGPPREHVMIRHRLPLLLVLLALTAGAAARSRHVTDRDLPRALPEQGPVAVRWEDPQTFSEIRYSRNASESRRGNWVEQLAAHLRKQAQPRLGAGERLEVTITDIDLAGEYEPWHGPQLYDTRVIRDLYPPRIALTFKRVAADGTTLAEGERKLTDPAFLMNSSTAGLASDPFRFEKSLIERWLQRELPLPSR